MRALVPGVWSEEVKRQYQKESGAWAETCKLEQEGLRGGSIQGPSQWNERISTSTAGAEGSDLHWPIGASLLSGICSPHSPPNSVFPLCAERKTLSLPHSALGTKPPLLPRMFLQGFLLLWPYQFRGQKQACCIYFTETLGLNAQWAVRSLRKKISCPCAILKKKSNFANWASNSFMATKLHQGLANASTFPLPSFRADTTSGLCSSPPTWLRSLFLPDWPPGSYEKLMKPVWTWWSNPRYIQ